MTSNRQTYTSIVRAGTKRLSDYFAATTRPAAVMSLINELNDSRFFKQRLRAMQRLVEVSALGQTLCITTLTPLGMLEDMTKGRVE